MVGNTTTERIAHQATPPFLFTGRHKELQSTAVKVDAAGRRNVSIQRFSGSPVQRGHNREDNVCGVGLRTSLEEREPL